MQDSIFLTIKELLGPDSSYTAFDPDILIHINSALATLTQLGVGPVKGMLVTDDTQKWSDFFGSDDNTLNMAKSYVYMKVKIAFDPPLNSSVLSAYQEACKEYEWRLNVAVDPEALPAVGP